MYSWHLYWEFVMRRFLCAMAFGLATCFAVAADKGGTGGTSTLSEFELALIAAQAQVPDGQLLRGRVEGLKTGGANFGFYFWRNNRVIEVEISQTGGDVLKVKDEQNPEDVKDINKDVALLVGKSAKSKIPEGRLLEIAADNLKGTKLSDVKYEKDGDKLVLVIGDVRIDAATGQVLTK